MINQTQTSQQIGQDVVTAAIRAARIYTAKRPVKSTTPITEANYIKIVERLEASQLMPDQLPLSTASRAQYSSAYVTITIKRLVPLLAACEPYLVGESVENINELVVQITQYVEVLDKLKSRLTFHKAVDTATNKFVDSHTKPRNITRISNQRNTKKTKKCKKIGLEKAPKNWQNLLLEEFSFDKSMQLALAAVEVTGCRPAELKRGVKLSFSARGGIIFCIEGVKVNSERGQPIRIIDLDYSTTPAFMLLFDHLSKNQTGEEIIAINDARQYSDRIRYRSRKLFPFFDTGLSSYSYRHAFSATQKRAGTSRSDLAKAMGHRSAVSQAAYARKKHGRKCNSYNIVSVYATHEIVKLHEAKCGHSEESQRDRPNLTMRM